MESLKKSRIFRIQLNECLLFEKRHKNMRKLFCILTVLSVLVSCKTKRIVTEIKTENILNYENISTIDSSLVEFIKPYTVEIDQEMQQVIAVSDVELVKKKPESVLSNYLADLMLYEGQLFATKQQGKPIPDIAYLNYGSIRTDLPKGKITVGKVFELMPFENEVVLLKLKGEELYELAETIAERGGSSVAGMTITIKDNKLGSFKINNKPVDRNRSYWLATNDYVANGGDSMNMLRKNEVRINTGILLRDCFIDHMQNEYRAGKTISPELDGRISYE